MVAARFSWDGICRQYREIFLRCMQRSLSIVIATPLMPPDLGGVGQYALNLAQEFSRRGHAVSVVSYARDPARMPKIRHTSARYVSLRYPTGLRHVMFFLTLLRSMRRADAALVLDQFSAGLPAALACAIARIPYVTRMEGDFLWESYVERTRRDVTLADFWRAAPNLTVKERLIRRVVRWVLWRASRIAFSSRWRKEMVESSIPVIAKKSLIIGNAWPSLENQAAHAGDRKKIILWAGRMLYVKNLHRLMRVFAGLGKTGYELHLVGEGPEEARLKKTAQSLDGVAIRFFPPMAHGDLLTKMASSAFVVLPSLSDVGPNIIADAIATRTPFLLTQESGYAEIFSQSGLLVHPLDERDIAEKLRILMDEKKQHEYRARLNARHEVRGWTSVADEWLRVLSDMV